MVRARSIRSAVRAALVAVPGTVLLGGCALLQPPPVPRMPRFGQPSGAVGVGAAACGADVAQAHAALAAAGAGAAAGDPGAVAAAHAGAALAMHEYHRCLARSSDP